MKTRNFIIKETIWKLLNPKKENLFKTEVQKHFFSPSSSFRTNKPFQIDSNQNLKSNDLKNSFSEKSTDKIKLNNNRKQLSTFSSMSNKTFSNNNISHLSTQVQKNTNDNNSNNLKDIIEKTLILFPDEDRKSQNNFENIQKRINTESNKESFKKKKSVSNKKEKQKTISDINNSKNKYKCLSALKNNKTFSQKKILSNKKKLKGRARKICLSQNKSIIRLSKSIMIRKFESQNTINLKKINGKKFTDLKNKMYLIDFNLNAKRYKCLKTIITEKEEKINSKLNYEFKSLNNYETFLSIKKSFIRNYNLNNSLIFITENFLKIKTKTVNKIEIGIINYINKIFEYSYYLPSGLNEKYNTNSKSYILDNFSLYHRPSIIEYFHIPKLNLFKTLLTPENLIYCQKFLKLENYFDKAETQNHGYKIKVRTSLHKQIKIIKKIQAKNNGKSTNILLNFIKAEKKLENFICYRNKNNLLFKARKKKVCFESNRKSMISKKRIPIIIDEKSNPIQLWNEIKNELIKCNIKNFYKLYNSKGKEIKLNYQNENGNTLLIFSAIYNLEEICFFLLRKGANPNLQNIFGNSALHYAISYKFFKLTNILIQFNANEDLINEQGLTPWECINTYCQYEI